MFGISSLPLFFAKSNLYFWYTMESTLTYKTYINLRYLNMFINNVYKTALTRGKRQVAPPIIVHVNENLLLGEQRLLNNKINAA